MPPAAKNRAQVQALASGRELRSGLPQGYGFKMLAYLADLGVGTDQSILSSIEVNGIKDWVSSSDIDVPTGWFGPDPWRLRSLQYVKRHAMVLSDEDLEDIVSDILEADVEDDVDERWRIPAPDVDAARSTNSVLSGTSAGPSAGSTSGSGVSIGDTSSDVNRLGGPKPMYKPADEVTWLALRPHLAQDATYKDVVVWTSQGDSTISGYRVGPSKTSKATGANQAVLRIPVECRQHPDCEMRWLFKKTPTTEWECLERKETADWKKTAHDNGSREAATTETPTPTIADPNRLPSADPKPDPKPPALLQFKNDAEMAKHLEMTYTAKALIARLEVSKIRISAASGQVTAKATNAVKLARHLWTQNETCMFPIPADQQPCDGPVEAVEAPKPPKRKRGRE